MAQSLLAAQNATPPDSAHDDDEGNTDDPQQELVEQLPKTPETLTVGGSQHQSNVQVQVLATQPPHEEPQENDLASLQVSIKAEGARKSSRDPQEILFDWDDFETRYVQAIEQADEQDHEIANNLSKLSSYFAAWSGGPAVSDTERSHKRLKTREVYVRHAENELENKKHNYNNVIEAFKNAMKLLEVVT